jgi:serine/threonine protein kinase
MTDFTGEYFDRFHLIAALGEGGMASVYKAYDTRLEREVAVKIIRTDMFMPAVLDKVIKRFEREAKSLAKLSHPNIVSVIDYGEHAGVPYLVMEYLPGGNLKDRLTGKPLPWQESFRLLLPVARALQFSHQQGIIHRDVKPSNILITLSGEPMLSDFGIARVLESEGSTSITGTGVGIGTPEYMAPEQWVGDTSPQSDLYSLGVVLYEMVTGRKPYTAETPAAVLLKQANDPLPRPRRFVPDLPDKVEKLIFKMLAKRPEDRQRGMGELITALEELMSGATRIKPSVFSWDKIKPGKRMQAEQQVPTVLSPMEDQPTLAAQHSEEGPPSEPFSRPGEPGSGGPAAHETAPPISEVPRPYPEEPARRKKLVLPGAWLRRRIKIFPYWLIGLAGVVLLAGLAAGTAFAVRWMRPQAVQIAPSSASAGYVYFASDQSGKAEIYYLDSKGKIVRVTQTPDPYGSWSPVPAKNGYLYFTSNQSGKAEVYYLDPNGKIVQFTHTPGRFESWSPAPAANGYVYFTSNQSGKAEVFYLDPAGKLVQFTHTPGKYESWSPIPAAGGYVYFSSNQSGKPEIYYLNLKGQLVQFTHTPDPFGSWSPAPTANGYVYFCSNQGGKVEVYYLAPNGKIVQFTHTPGLFVSWSPVPAANGYVYFTSNQSGKAEIYYLDPKGKLVQFTHTPEKYESWLFMYGKTSANTQP